MTAPSPPPPPLDPPFRGYIETTFDALLVFEAARRGMIPRVTRRLIERERGMVQSGAVFVFDEHESGIKRWTDGLVWSPSRILGNFLVYRETDKRPMDPPTPMSTSNPTSISPPRHPPTSTPLGQAGAGSLPGPAQYAESSQMGITGTPPGHSQIEPPPVLGGGALPRPRSASEGCGSMDRQRERQLVGSLTNSYKFKEGGLVKKTMSVTVNGFAQHMISYYSVEDVMTGKLRSPSTIPELASLEISPEYLHKQNFRFPPMIEVGQDGVPRYRGEPEEPTSPQSPISNLSMHFLPPSSSGELYNPYGLPPHHPHQPQATRLDSSNQPRHRAVTVPAPIQLPSPGHPHNLFPPGPSSAGSSCFDQQSMRPPPIARHASSSSLTGSAPGAMRPGSSARRFEPYSGSGPPVSSPRVISHSVPEYFPPHINLKSNSNSYYYQTSPSAPGSFADFYGHPPQQQQPQAPPAHFPSPYAATAWQQSQSPGQIGRLMPREYAGDPPSSSGSSGSPGPPPGSSGAGTGAGAGWIPGQGQGQWEGSGQYPPGEWREQGQGTGVAQ